MRKGKREEEGGGEEEAKRRVRWKEEGGVLMAFHFPLIYLNGKRKTQMTPTPHKSPLDQGEDQT